MARQGARERAHELAWASLAGLVHCGARVRSAAWHAITVLWRGLRRVLASVRRIAGMHWWRHPAVALLFLGMAYWAAETKLGIEPAPRQSPPKVVGLPPTQGIHSARSGYVIRTELRVRDCESRVQGVATVLLPREWVLAEGPDKDGVEIGEEDPAKALFGLAFNDPDVHVSSIDTPGRRIDLPGRPDAFPKLPQWNWTFKKGKVRDSRGRVALARFDDWKKGPRTLQVEFDADWLRPRGHRSCWLGTPQLVGNLFMLSHSSAESVNIKLGKRSGADPLATGKFGGSLREIIYRPDGTFYYGKWITKNLYTDQYATDDSPAAHGNVTLNSTLHIMPGESVASVPTAGRPEWSCDSTVEALRLYESQKGEDVPPGVLSGEPLSSYRPPVEGDRCEGWVALAEAGAESARDSWLLIVGAALSAGVALLVDLVLGGPARRQQRRAAALSPGPPSH